MIKILITIIIASIGGLIGYYLKIPAGGMLGAMTAVAIYNIFYGNAYIPVKFKVFAQILTGGIIGLSFNMGTLKEIKDAAIPILASIFTLMTICILIGFVLHKVTGIDLATALFSMAPGGLTDMTLAAQDVGASASIIAVFHFTRLVLVISLMPSVIKILTAYISK